MSAKPHIAVLGAGLIGAASAWELVRAGFRVTLVEPGEPGGQQAASYGNAGWISSHSVIPPSSPGLWKKIPSYLLDPLGPLAIRWAYLPQATPWLLRYIKAGNSESKVERTATALRTLLRDASILHKELAKEAGVGQLVECNGVLHIYRTREDYLADETAWRIRQQQGVVIREIDADELRNREPDLHSRYGFGILVPEAASCRNPGSYVAALVAGSLSRGGTLLHAKAMDLRLRDGRLAAVRTTEGDLVCDHAIICAGAHSKALAAAVGDRIPLDTERGYHATITGSQAGPRTSMMAMDCKLVVNALDTGLRVAGQVEVAGLRAEPNWKRAEILFRHLLSMFPKLSQKAPLPQATYWMGHRPSLPDGLPCIGFASATRDVIYAFGHGHVGFGAAPRTGRLIAQLLVGADPEIPLEPFSPRRFAR